MRAHSAEIHGLLSAAEVTTLQRTHTQLTHTRARTVLKVRPIKLQFSCDYSFSDCDPAVHHVRQLSGQAAGGPGDAEPSRVGGNKEGFVRASHFK